VVSPESGSESGSESGAEERALYGSARSPRHVFSAPPKRQTRGKRGKTEGKKEGNVEKSEIPRAIADL